MVSSHLLDLIDDLCSHLLILHRGECLFQGTIAEAKNKMESAGPETSLEEIFFQFTEPAAAVASDTAKE